MAPRKKAAKPLKKGQYRCVGGPLERVYLPGIERGDYKTPLPDQITWFDTPGYYNKRYDPVGDTTFYEWIDQ